MEKVYAGWIGKIIGVRHGAPVEGWSYENLHNTYGEIDGYLVDYKDFAADDDSNGPMFFLRALEDYTHTPDITAEQIGLTWLNYAPFEHGFYWWGGYGKSTEHTAYLNLRNGIPAPRSGSVEQNGAVVAEQIGGQIFIDTWGLVIPNNPKLASEYAQKAASVSHGGNGVYGGMFIAACISAAFEEKDMERILEEGLAVIPADCEYTRMSREVMNFHKAHPEDWRECFKFVQANFGYDRYTGGCHIIPNSAIIVLSLLYGEGDFSKTLNICNMCGWDTDCNVANAGTIMGVRNGLGGIDYNKWRKPVNDFIACSSVIGSLNIMDLPWSAVYIADLAYKIAGEEVPAEWKDIFEGNAARFHFEFPGSTHGFRASADVEGNQEYTISHTTEVACKGSGALKVVAGKLGKGKELKVFHKTYYRPENFHDSRYDPSFSPIIYPGQTMSGSIMVTEEGARACLYVMDGNGRRHILSPWSNLKAGEWSRLSFDIPKLEGACIEEAGFMIIPKYDVLLAYIDEFDFRGNPDYTIDFSKEKMEVWNPRHLEVSQFTYLKGIWTLEDGELSGSCCDFGEAYTGGHDWKDYSFEATLKPMLGEFHGINFRVQGAIRSYAVGLVPDNKLVLSKNENGYRTLKTVEFPWQTGGEYTLKVEAAGAEMRILSGDRVLMEYTDSDKPYLKGQIGVSIQKGSHCHYKNFIIGKL